MLWAAFATVLHARRTHALVLPPMGIPVCIFPTLTCSFPFFSPNCFTFYLFLPRRHNVAQRQFPQTVNLPLCQKKKKKVGLFARPFARLGATRVGISKKPPGERRGACAPCRHQIDSLAFIIPFSSPSFVFSPARRASAASGAPLPSASGPPCFNCCFRVLCVDVSDTTASVLISLTLNYPIYPRFIR